jgi:hypothetical protein
MSAFTLGHWLSIVSTSLRRRGARRGDARASLARARDGTAAVGRRDRRHAHAAPARGGGRVAERALAGTRIGGRDDLRGAPRARPARPAADGVRPEAHVGARRRVRALVGRAMRSSPSPRGARGRASNGPRWPWRSIPSRSGCAALSLSLLAGLVLLGGAPFPLAGGLFHGARAHLAPFVAATLQLAGVVVAPAPPGRRRGFPGGGAAREVAPHTRGRRGARRRRGDPRLPIATRTAHWPHS